MITEQLIYITEDNLRFLNKLNAEDYDVIHNKLHVMELQHLGRRIQYPMGIGSGPCLESIQHNQEDIVKIITFITNAIYQWHIDNKHTDSKNPSLYNDILNKLTELQNNTDIKETNFLYHKVLDSLKNFIFTYYYNDETYIYLTYMIPYKIYQRLYNISYKSGIEYPLNDWVNREDKWLEYVESEKAYQANGGKYR